MTIQCFKAKLNQNNEKKNSYRRQYIRPAFLNYCSLWLSSDFLVESAHKCKHRDRLSQVMDDCLSVLFFFGVWGYLFWLCRYEAGDHVAVYPVNDSELVNLIGKSLDVDLDQMFTLTNLDGRSNCPFSGPSNMVHYDNRLMIMRNL